MAKIEVIAADVIQQRRDGKGPSSNTICSKWHGFLTLQRVSNDSDAVALPFRGHCCGQQRWVTGHRGLDVILPQNRNRSGEWWWWWWGGGVIW